MRILIADNNVNLGYVMKNELEDEGYTVDRVADGVEAVSTIIESPVYDFILLDMMLPKLDGLNALRLIKKIDPKAGVIMVSEAMVYGDRELSLKAGALACFPKPYEIEKIKDYIREQMTAKTVQGRFSHHAA